MLKNTKRPMLPLEHMKMALVFRFLSNFICVTKDSISYLYAEMGAWGLRVVAPLEADSLILLAELMLNDSGTLLRHDVRHLKCLIKRNNELVAGSYYKETAIAH